MKPNNYHEQLLDDVLLDEELNDLKQGVLSQCLGQLRYRRHRDYSIYTIAAVAAILLMVLILRRDAVPPRPVDGFNTPDYVVRTVPLSEHQIVRTAVSCETIRTRDNACLIQNTSIASDLKVQGRQKVAQLDDSEMLKLFEGVSCGIIRPQGGQSRLVFFDPEDSQRYFGTP